MKQFKFRFEAVLKVRKIREEEALRRVAEREKVLHDEIELKEKNLRDLDATLNRMEQFGRVPSSVGGVLAEKDFAAGLRIRITQCENRILRAKKNLDRAMAYFLAARTQTRMMEALSEKALIEFKKEAAKKEQKRLDEMVLARFKGSA
jgi:flagellar export protein FliJ